jgi:D-hexose-6-phosphate mutarotase
VVVWNPHLTMKDSYEQFVCVENAIAQDAVTVKPGENWRATTTFNVVDVK